MKKEKNLWMARIAIVAALYVVLTLISYPFSYGMIQFRISEALMLLCCYDKRYTWSMVIGCIVSKDFQALHLKHRWLQGIQKQGRL